MTEEMTLLPPLLGHYACPHCRGTTLEHVEPRERVSTVLAVTEKNVSFRPRNVQPAPRTAYYRCARCQAVYAHSFAVLVDRLQAAAQGEPV